MNAISEAKKFCETCKTVMIGSVDEAGYPNIKGMLKLKSDGIRQFVLSSSTTSGRTLQYKKNPNACLYFVDENDYTGLMLIGTMEVLEDLESKKKYWNESLIGYYPQGPETDYLSLYRFTTKSGQYYHRRPYNFSMENE